MACLAQIAMLAEPDRDALDSPTIGASGHPFLPAAAVTKRSLAAPPHAEMFAQATAFAADLMGEVTLDVARMAHWAEAWDHLARSRNAVAIGTRTLGSEVFRVTAPTGDASGGGYGGDRAQFPAERAASESPVPLVVAGVADMPASGGHQMRDRDLPALNAPALRNVTCAVAGFTNNVAAFQNFPGVPEPPALAARVHRPVPTRVALLADRAEPGNSRVDSGDPAAFGALPPAPVILGIAGTAHWFTLASPAEHR